MINCIDCGKQISRNAIRCKPCSKKGDLQTLETRLKNSLGNLGRKRSNETKKKLSISKQTEKNPMWKGDKVGYISLHEWIKNHKVKPKFCEECKKNKPYDLANISGNYKRDVNDFEWLCRKCHMKKDGRLEKLKIVGLSNVKM